MHTLSHSKHFLVISVLWLATLEHLIQRLIFYSENPSSDFLSEPEGKLQGRKYMPGSASSCSNTENHPRPINAGAKACLVLYCKGNNKALKIIMQLNNEVQIHMAILHQT